MLPVSAALRRLLVLVVLAGSLLGLTASLATAQETPPGDTDTRVIEVLPLDGGFVDPPVAAQISDVLDLAAAEGSELVVLQFSSGGGVSVDLEELLGQVAASEVPVAALVGPIGTAAEARGAGGALWLGAHLRAISADATVGPLAPADLAAMGDTAAVERARQLVLAAGGDEELAQTLLSEPVGAERLAASGVATLTSQGLEPLLVELDGMTVATAGGEEELRIRADEIRVRFHSLGLVRRLLHAASTAPFIYLLVVAGLVMLLFEVFQPGFGVAGLAGLVTLAIGTFGLTVLPVTWWAVALVVLGLLLYGLDTAIAGFGPVTLAATVAFAVGSLNLYAADPLGLPVWLVLATTVAVLVFFVLVMTSLLRAQAGPEGVQVDELVGRPGIVRSVLNPEGHVYIDGALWRARWTGEAKRAKVGTPVRVHAVDGPVVLVEPFDTDGGDTGTGTDPLTKASGR